MWLLVEMSAASKILFLVLFFSIKLQHRSHFQEIDSVKATQNTTRQPSAKIRVFICRKWLVNMTMNSLRKQYYKLYELIEKKKTCPDGRICALNITYMRLRVSFKIM